MAGHGKKGFKSGGTKRPGKRTSRPYKGPRFEGTRLAGVEDETPHGSSGEPAPGEGQVVQNEEDEEDEQSVSDDEEDDDDDGSVVGKRPYADLMRSLLASTAPPAKRRKLAAAAPSKGQSPAAPVEEAGQLSENLDDVDLVDEPEEAAEAAEPDQAPGDEENEAIDLSDPFEAHFAEPNDKEVSRRLKAIGEGRWDRKIEAMQGFKMTWSAPTKGEKEATSYLRSITRPADLKLKKRLAETALSKWPSFVALESVISPILFQYGDLLFCERSLDNAEGLRRAACLHAVNHVFKTRDRIIKNNARLSREDEHNELELRDQGFTRPKVLFLLPTRQSCAKMVQMMRSICEPDQQENRARFDDAFIEKEEKFSVDKPADFRDLFGGNDDDMFRIGVKFTRKTIKFYAQFYNSDILLASPLGLRMAIGAEGEKEKKPDYDFLSSIELVVVDQADALLMQNWEHVESIFEHLNLQPKDSHGCDFSRVRNWYLDKQAKFFRQTLIFTAFNTPELTELFRLHCNNWTGKAKIQLQEYPGVIQSLEGIKARQTFCRFELRTIADDPEARFAYFTSTIMPLLTKRAAAASKNSSSGGGGTLLFIPSYLDFVRVRNYFASEGDGAARNITFATISEYTGVGEASRARSHFAAGRIRVLLYTERAHHFRRYRLLRGASRVVLYGLPDNPLFYREIVGGSLRASEQALLLEPGQGSVRVMFSRFDVAKLERVVGTKRVARMIQEKGDVFEFV